jgi:hypothetical protein
MMVLGWVPGVSQLHVGDWVPVGFWRLVGGEYRCAFYSSVSIIGREWCVIDEDDCLVFVGSRAEISAYFVDNGYVLESL